MIDFAWLSALIVLPIIGALVLWLLPKAQAKQARTIALAFSLLQVVLFVFAALQFDTGNAGNYQLNELQSWIPQLGVSWALGVNGLSLALVGLSVALVPLVVLAAWREQSTGDNFGYVKLRHYMALILVLEAFMVGIFVARDVFLFYVIFEAMLIPVYFMIGGFGQGIRRRYAAIKFLIFSLAGGLVMLAAMIYLYAKSAGGPQAFLIDQLAQTPLSTNEERWIFLGFFLAFAIKAPMFPVHSWLPDAAQHAPAGTSVLLVGVLDKVGTFGMLTLTHVLFPEATKWAAPVIIVFAVISIIYGGLLAIGQTDIMRFIAYTSVSHFGFIVLGIYTFTELGTAGSGFYMINHGISTGLMFLVAGFLILRSPTKSQNMNDFGGMQKIAPVLAGVFLVGGLSALSMPGLSTFVSEIMVLMAAIEANTAAAVVSAFGVVLAALYVLLAYQKVFTGAPNEKLKAAKDLTRREKLVAAPLVAALLVLGFVPGLALKYIEPAAKTSVVQLEKAASANASGEEK